MAIKAGAYGNGSGQDGVTMIQIMTMLYHKVNSIGGVWTLKKRKEEV